MRQRSGGGGRGTLDIWRIWPARYTGVTRDPMYRLLPSNPLLLLDPPPASKQEEGQLICSDTNKALCPANCLASCGTSTAALWKGLFSPSGPLPCTHTETQKEGAFPAFHLLACLFSLFWFLKPTGCPNRRRWLALYKNE